MKTFVHPIKQLKSYNITRDHLKQELHIASTRYEIPMSLKHTQKKKSLEIPYMTVWSPVL